MRRFFSTVHCFNFIIELTNYDRSSCLFDWLRPTPLSLCLRAHTHSHGHWSTLANRIDFSWKWPVHFESTIFLNHLKIKSKNEKSFYKKKEMKCLNSIWIPFRFHFDSISIQAQCLHKSEGFSSGWQFIFPSTMFGYKSVWSMIMCKFWNIFIVFIQVNESRKEVLERFWNKF